MAKKMFGVVCAAALALSLGACGGGQPGGAATPSGGTQGQQAIPATDGPGQDDSIKIDEIDWTVEPTIESGTRRVTLAYTNNSKYAVINIDMQFTQREDVTDEQRSVFDEVYEGDFAPTVEPSEFYVDGENAHYTKPGESAEPSLCTLAYTGKILTMDQYELMEPSYISIEYLGGDGKVYLEYYDFLNDNYSIDSDHTKEVVDWPDNELGQLAPVIEKKDAVVIHDDEDDRSYVYVYGPTEDDFAPYVEQCKNAGFTSVETDSDTWFEASNDEGYTIEVVYRDYYDALCIAVEKA